MTAEIAIINKTAIALAADSKVTLSIGGHQKTFDTVDKLFSLSKTHPVGAMIYGGAEFMGFPWETIIKEYRRQKPKKCFGTIIDWAEDLLAFLITFFEFRENDTSDVVARIGFDALDQFADVIRNIEQRDGTATPEVVNFQLSEMIAALAGAEDFINQEDWPPLAAKYASVFDRVIESGLSPHVQADGQLVRQLVEMVVRKNQPSRSHSGLVIAGFGDKELLPSLVSFEIDGVIEGRLKYRLYTEFNGTRQNRGVIVPFAQRDMVHRFMEGIDPRFSDQIKGAIEEITIQTAANTAQALIDDPDRLAEVLPALTEAAKSQVASLAESIQRYQQQNFSGPIIDMTMSLPKDELANLAESLVSLTSLQRKVSREIETVGGAIDVAVISKGDGFVWIKRKHYFSPDRNIRFVSGYFSEYETTEAGDQDA